MLVQALLQRDAHFHAFFIEILHSGLQVPLLFSIHLGESILILLWIFEKKHYCSLLCFPLQVKYFMTSHMLRGRRSMAAVLTRSAAGFLWWWLLPYTAGHPLLLTLRRCLIFTAVHHVGLLEHFLSTLPPLIHLLFCCVAFADFQTSSTQALFPLWRFLNHSWLFAVCQATPTFPNVFSQPSCWFLFKFDWDEQRWRWAWSDGAYKS